MAKHLSYEERIKIETMLDLNMSVLEISKELGRHHSTIYREIQRPGTCFDDYYAKQYHNQARLNMSRQQDDKAPSQLTIKFIEEKIINEQWSPEQISNCLEKYGYGPVSHTWIYQYVQADKVEGGELHNHLRHGGSYRKGAKEYKGKIPNRISIEERPIVVQNRERIGDYEIDLIVGPKNKGAILTMVDRASRECRLRKLDGKGADNVLYAVKQLSFDNILTITSDNGTEFTKHEEISKHLKADYYFAHPYASYERGSIENLNGLIRQYIPKGKEFNQITDNELCDIETKLNNRPRKVLDFLTPVEYNKRARKNSHLRV